MVAIIEFGPFALEHPSGLIATILGLVLLVVLAKPLGKFLGLPQPSVVLAERSQQIENDTLQVERQLQNVAQMRNDYANRIQTIETEQRERIAAAVRDADNARTDIIAEAEETARAFRRRGEEEMERERTRQRILLRQKIVQTTLDAAEQAIKAQNSDTVQRQLIRDFTANIANSNGHGQISAPVPTAAVAAPFTPTIPAQVPVSYTAPETVPAAPTVPPVSPAPTFTAAAPVEPAVSSDAEPVTAAQVNTSAAAPITPGASVYDAPKPYAANAAPTETMSSTPDFTTLDNEFNPAADLVDGHAIEQGEA